MPLNKEIKPNQTDKQDNDNNNHKENEKRDKYWDLARELKKTTEYESDGDANYISRTWNGRQRLGKGNGRVGIQRTNRDHPNYSIVMMDQNTGESPADRRTLTVKDYQLT